MTNIEIIDKARSIISDPERPDVLPLDDIGTISAALAIARAIVRRTAEHDKAMEEGRLVELPCKIGQTVFVITNVFDGAGTVKTIRSRTIDEIKHNKLNKNTMISKQPYELHFYPSEIGKTVFLTRQEAEVALHGGGEGS